MRRLQVAVALAVAVPGSVANAAAWDFNDGTPQGWTIVGGGGIGTKPGAGPNGIAEPGDGDGSGKIVLEWVPLDYLPKTGNAPRFYDYPYALPINAATGQIHEVNEFRLGGDLSWSQFYVDNVTCTLLPEPAAFLLAAGAILMLRRSRQAEVTDRVA